MVSIEVLRLVSEGEFQGWKQGCQYNHNPLIPSWGGGSSIYRLSPDRHQWDNLLQFNLSQIYPQAHSSGQDSCIRAVAQAFKTSSCNAPVCKIF